jgi:hypothetical protein
MITAVQRRILSAAFLASALALVGILTSSAAPAPAAPAPFNAAPLDLSGIWVREGNLWFEAVFGDTDNDGKPIDRLRVRSRDAEQIYAGDSTNPILQPWARDIVKNNAESEIRLEHVYTADDSCWPSGVPQVLNLLDGIQFLEAKDHIVIVYQRDHQVRWIWLNREHSANVKPSWYGESVGHYEGDTLVVDTIGQKAHKMSVVDPFGTPHTGQIHVVERYRPFKDPGGRGLEITVRVVDPGAFTMPWKGTAEYRQMRQPSFDEMICAENNRSFANGSTFGPIPVETKPAF